MSRARVARAGGVIALLGFGFAPGIPADSSARPIDARPVTAPSKPTAASKPTASTRPTAPSDPPLSTAPALTGTSGEQEAATPQGEADPLVSNGLGSPLCTTASPAGLAAAQSRNCQTSGFVAAPAPTADYGIDVHIDTGLLGLSYGGMLSAVQDLFVTPVWMALVWMVHALVVMVEWAFTVDLFSAADGVGLAQGLRTAEADLTGPWLALALAIASICVAYNGLVRRRVADTLGEALLMGAMMLGGVWVTLDPGGTVGALARWANEASLGTLAAVASGTPATPARALGQSLGVLFTAGVEGPWCYLEFGNVGWCRDADRLEAGLRSAGLKIAAEEQAKAGCARGGGACASAGASASALEHSARLLREAGSNGAIFLALPANGAARNSINDGWSLLRAICRAGSATECSGPAAAEAGFRTDGGTWPRVAGLLLIGFGLIGMAMLLGYVVARLLGSALLGLLLLMLAPGMVLSPAFGEGGRSLFRRWLAQLLGAAVAKLLFSFLLGAILAVLAIISDLRALGWWTQWLLMTMFWWGAFVRRRPVLEALGYAASNARHERPAGGGLRHALERHGRRTAGERLRRQRRDAPEPPSIPADADAEQPSLAPAAGRPAPSQSTQAQAQPQHGAVPRGRLPGSAPDLRAGQPGRGETPDLPGRGAESDPGADAHADADDGRADADDTHHDADDRWRQLGRIRTAHAEAERAGDRRRAARLQARATRVERELSDAAGPRRDGRVPARDRGNGPGGRRGSKSTRVHDDDPSSAEQFTSEALLNDVRAVVEGRKRQFGIGLP